MAKTEGRQLNVSVNLYCSAQCQAGQTSLEQPTDCKPGSRIYTGTPHFSTQWSRDTLPEPERVRLLSLGAPLLLLPLLSCTCNQPHQASDPFVCAPESPEHRLAPAAQVRALGSNSCGKAITLAPQYACMHLKRAPIAHECQAAPCIAISCALAEGAPSPAGA